MQNNIPDGLIEKIQKLLNLQQGAEAVGSISEAENAAARIQQLLLKHNLDMDTVTSTTIASKAKMDNVRIMCQDIQDKRESNWVTKLYAGIARNNLCKVFVYTDDSVQILGHVTNVQLVVFIAEQMVSKIRISEKISWKQYDAEPDPWNQKEKRGTYRRGFFTGAALGISRRLAEDMEAARQPDNPYAVMVVHKEKEVQEYIYELYPHLRPPSEAEIAENERKHQEWLDSMTDAERKAYEKRINKPVKYRKGPKGISSSAGLRNGYEAGKQMSINKGVDHSQPKANIS